MEKNRLNFWIDVLIFLIFVCLLFTGFMMYLIPRGYGGILVSGLTRHEWGDIHIILALIFISLIIIHVILHWSWEKRCFKSFLKIGPKTLIIITILLIAFLLITPMILTRDIPERGKGRDGEHNGEVRDSYDKNKGRVSYFMDGGQNEDWGGGKLRKRSR